ncbi:UNVERIFIED_CONTAM: Kctd9 [Trichonephila clavipes]
MPNQATRNNNVIAHLPMTSNLFSFDRAEEECPRRVVLYKNGSSADGKAIRLPDSLDILLTEAGKKLGVEAKLLFTVKGGEIDDVNLIKDDDILYVSSGEPYIVSHMKLLVEGILNSV